MTMLTVLYESHRMELEQGQVATIGRGSGTPLAITDQRVSREHLRVTWGPNGWMVESVGRTPSFVNGQPIRQLLVTQPLEVRLAAPDGPLVRFEPPVAAAAAEASPAVAAAAAAPGGADELTDAWAAAVPAGAAVAAPPRAAGNGAGAAPIMPGGMALANEFHMSGTEIRSALHILVPFKSWLRDRDLRSWYRLLVAIYGLIPVGAVAFFSGSLQPNQLAEISGIYFAPIWMVVFWYLIKPGRLGRRELGVAVFIVVFVLVWMQIVTINVNDASWASNGRNLFTTLIAPGYNEEITKALPVLLAAVFLLKQAKVKLSVRMWLFMGSLAGVTFGAFEAYFYISKRIFIDLTVDGQPIPLLTVPGAFSFLDRLLVDGFQHALWAGISGVFIGLGINYGRRRVPIILFGLSLAAVLHALNDWVLSGVFGTNHVLWFLIQLFSVFLFLGYTATASTIEEQVRRSPIFRGESRLLDPSVVAGAEPAETPSRT
jgi:RsiW-degrading membrane proteinase PrsW (M82 family)